MIEIGNFPVLRIDGESSELTIAAGCVIVQDGKVLLIRDDKDDFWKFPGGTIRTDESWEQAAVRECYEESGLTVLNMDDLPFVLTFEKDKEGVRKMYILIHYFVQKYEGVMNPIRFDVEVCEWLDIDDLPEDCGPNVKPVVEHFVG